MVIDLYDLFRFRVILIGDPLPRTRIDDDEKGVRINFLGDEILCAAKGEIIGKVLVGEVDLLFGIGIAQELSKTVDPTASPSGRI